jgi:CubicO group peptidase (beta-lactamase class C family)
MPLLPPCLVARAQAPSGAEDLSLFDAFLAQQIETLHIPGLAFVLVRDGQVAFIVGYGQAVVEDGVPILHVCRRLCRALCLLPQLLELAGIPPGLR